MFHSSWPSPLLLAYGEDRLPFRVLAFIGRDLVDAPTPFRLCLYRACIGRYSAFQMVVTQALIGEVAIPRWMLNNLFQDVGLDVKDRGSLEVVDVYVELMAILAYEMTIDKLCHRYEGLVPTPLRIDCAQIVKDHATLKVVE